MMFTDPRWAWLSDQHRHGEYQSLDLLSLVLRSVQWCLLGAWRRCSLSKPLLDLLNQNLRFNRSRQFMYALQFAKHWAG